MIRLEMKNYNMILTEKQQKYQLQALEEHGKQFFITSNERMSEIKNLSKQIDFNSLTYYFRVKVIQKNLSVLKFHQLFIEI